MRARFREEMTYHCPGVGLVKLPAGTEVDVVHPIHQDEQQRAFVRRLGTERVVHSDGEDWKQPAKKVVVLTCDLLPVDWSSAEPAQLEFLTGNAQAATSACPEPAQAKDPTRKAAPARKPARERQAAPGRRKP